MTIASSSILPKGVYTPITTFYKDNGKYSLDLDAQVAHATWLYQSGISGLVVAGSMGEAAHLTVSERRQLVAAIRAAIPDPNFKLIAGAPPLGSIQEAVQESQSAKEGGADFIILLVPGYFGPNLTSQAGIVDYFTAVADQSALPVVVYNYPGTCNNVPITLESYQAMAEHPNIVGAKLTHFNLDLYAMLGQDTTMKEQNFRPFTGLGQVLVPAMAVGCYGAIDGLSGIFPRVMVKLFSLYQQGNHKEAGELQSIVAKADRMIGDLNLVGTKLTIKKYHGFGDCLTGRPPLSRGTEAAVYAKYENDLDVVAEMEKTLKGEA